MADWTPDQHRVAELEAEAAYWRGYAAGQLSEREAMRRWAERFCDSDPGTVPTPLATRHGNVIRSLTERMIRRPADA